VKQLDLFGPRLTGRDVYATARLNPTVAPEDVPRLTAALQRLYHHMRDGEWCTGPSLIPIAGLRYGARLEELKRAGIPFERQHLSEGIWQYRLVASPTNGIG
jgi:hypothetical protein